MSVVPKGFASEKARREYEEAAPVFKYQRAAERGVDVTSGIDPAIRAKVGLLNFNPDTAAYVMDELLRTSIPEGEVPEGIPYAANIEGVPSALVRQEDGGYRYHAIDPTGFDSGDLAEFAGELPQLALETADTLIARDPARSHTVTVTAQGTLAWDKDDVTLQQFINNLQQYKLQDPLGKILINGDEEASFSQAVYVFDEVRKAGFEKVWIETRVKPGN